MYTEYLERYPEGEDHERLNQRLRAQRATSVSMVGFVLQHSYSPGIPLATPTLWVHDTCSRNSFRVRSLRAGLVTGATSTIARIQVFILCNYKRRFRRRAATIYSPAAAPPPFFRWSLSWLFARSGCGLGRIQAQKFRFPGWRPYQHDLTLFGQHRIGAWISDRLVVGIDSYNAALGTLAKIGIRQCFPDQVPGNPHLEHIQALRNHEQITALQKIE